MLRSVSDWLLWTFALCGVLAVADTVRLLLRRLLQPRPGPAVCLLVLVQNQEEQVERCVHLLAALLRRLPFAMARYEMIVADVASADGTGEVLERIARRDSFINVVRLLPEQVPLVFRIAHDQCSDCVPVILDLRGRPDPDALLRWITAMRQ